MHLEACTEKTIADYNFNTFPPRDTPPKKKKKLVKVWLCWEFQRWFQCSVPAELRQANNHISTAFLSRTGTNPSGCKTLALGLFWVTSRFWDTTLGTTGTLSNFTCPTNTRATQPTEKVSKRELTWQFVDVTAQTYRPMLSNPVSIHWNSTYWMIQRVLCYVFCWLTRSRALAERQLMQQLVLWWETALFYDAFKCTPENCTPNSKSKLKGVFGVCKNVF